MMISDVVASKWFFYYLQLWGLHSNDSKKNVKIFYQFILMALLIVCMVFSVDEGVGLFSGAIGDIVFIFESKKEV